MAARGDGAVRRFTVLGTGYLGTVHAAWLAEKGFRSARAGPRLGEDRRATRGVVPFYEPGLEPLLRSGPKSGRLSFTMSYAEVAAFGDLHFVCVGTPQRPGSRRADLPQVHGCLRTLGTLLDRPCLVVGKSTVPVGTAELLAERLSVICPTGLPCELAWNPEFLREGSAIHDTMRPDRIIVGVTSARAEAMLRQVYAEPIAAGTPLLLTDLPTAEIVKVAANAFLATKISFINAMAEVCEATNADVTKLSEALGLDPRIGAAALPPGLGFGGGCLPKDIRPFMARDEELGVDQVLSFLREVHANQHAAPGPHRGPGKGTGRRVPERSNDRRADSPALDVAATMHRLGAAVTVYDPAALVNARQAHPELSYAGSALEAVTSADVALLLTEWQEFRDADPEELGGVAAKRNIVDGRNALDADSWRAVG